MVRAAPWWPRFQHAADVVAGFVREHAPKAAANKVTRRAAYVRVVGIAVRWMERIGVPVSPKALTLNLDKTPALVGAAFPGYAESGLLGWVFKGR